MKLNRLNNQIMNLDIYFPHDVCMRHNPEVISLIESENASGYGIYWAILEYLRTQEGYKGDIRAIKGIARQVKTRLDKAVRVLNDYGLFVIEGSTFYSPALNEMMKPLEQKRARKKMLQDAKTVNQTEDGLFCTSSNTLVTSRVSSKVKESKRKQKEIISKENVDAVGQPLVPAALAWERYIDELQHEQQWIEIMAMRSGLGLLFVQRFREIMKHFKHHVQAVGNEKDIKSLADAKRYFCFFNTPGSATFKLLVRELQKPIDKGKYKYEERDPVTGQRSYCGVSIPDDAPPRPNEQAVWCEGKWVF